MPIEQRGVDTIPDEERTSGPRDLISILLGSNLALGVVIFGWLPVSFGLGFWPSVTSLVAGTLVGTLLTARSRWSRCAAPPTSPPAAAPTSAYAAGSSARSSVCCCRSATPR